MQPCFSAAEAVAGLSLKAIKCKLVPLLPFSQALADQIREWLSSNIPAWKDFSIAPTAKYLGFFLGPMAGTKQWESPIQKYCDRVEVIASSGAATALCAYSYNIRTVPVLSYVAQLVPLPPLLSADRDILP